MTGPEPLRRRERVTAPEQVSVAKAQGEGYLNVDTVYVRSLVRSQLRLALACAAGFALILVGFTLAFLLAPDLGTLLVAGIPVSWLMLGFGVYPLVIVIALIYVRAASRNEAGYLSLSDRDEQR